VDFRADAIAKYPIDADLHARAAVRDLTADAVEETLNKSGFVIYSGSI
jgi:quinol monooxygenase YgiN